MILVKRMNFVENVAASKSTYWKFHFSCEAENNETMKQSDRLLWLIANRKLFSRDVVFV